MCVAMRVASDLPGSVVTQHDQPYSLAAAMGEANVPGVSVAVFVDGRLAWSRAWGVLKLGGPTRVTAATLFQAASISKPVTALAAMTMVADGRLALDRDVSHSIDGWTATAPINLRQLLSHSAGLNVAGFQGYAANAAVPTPLQILRGDRPSNTPAVVIENTPGQAFNYSGGGYTVVQVLMAQTAAKPFSDLMTERVLAPLGMTDSFFAQPLPLLSQANAASGHRDGKAVAEGSNTYPELAAAGLWTTPRDLGKVAVDIQNARRSIAAAVATPAISRDMLVPQAGGYGLGFELKSLDGEPVFEHAGLNEGFEARLVASAGATGPRYVVVVMTNGQGGTTIADGLIRAVARHYAWRAYSPQTVRKVSLPPRDLVKFEGYYRSGDQAFGIELNGPDLFVRDGGWRPARMIPTSARTFVVENRPGTYEFTAGRASIARTLTILQAGARASFMKTEQLSASSDTGPVFLRGTMNDWQSVTPFARTEREALEVTIVLTAGHHEFKIGDKAWRDVNLGARLDRSVATAGTALPLSPMGGNLSFETPISGRYRFIVQTPPNARATLTIMPIAP